MEVVKKGLLAAEHIVKLYIFIQESAVLTYKLLILSDNYTQMGMLNHLSHCVSEEF